MRTSNPTIHNTKIKINMHTNADICCLCREQKSQIINNDNSNVDFIDKLKDILINEPVSCLFINIMYM